MIKNDEKYVTGVHDQCPLRAPKYKIPWMMTYNKTVAPAHLNTNKIDDKKKMMTKCDRGPWLPAPAHLNTNTVDDKKWDGGPQAQKSPKT